MGRRNKSWYGFLYKKKFYRRIGLYAFSTLVIGLLFTVFVALFTYLMVESREQKEFVFTAHEIRYELIDCLEDHALTLRAGMAFMSMVDTVSREDWRRYINLTMMNKYMPEQQGMGFVKIIPKGNVEKHIQSVRAEGFSEYRIFPSYEREVYTSIVFIEPFSDRNKRAFGYDMYTEPVRRKAMDHSCDHDLASLTGRFKLALDTDGEELYGSLMFVPFYDQSMIVKTTEQRRNAIRGWLYSPFRIKTLFDEIYEYAHPDIEIRVQVYDEVVSDSTILYDSYGIDSDNNFRKLVRETRLSVDFNHNKWILLYSEPRKFPLMAGVILIAGLIINILLYMLMKGFLEIENRSQQIRMKNKQLRTLNATKDKFFSIIAHDLKSPYNAVLGFSDLLSTHIDRMDRGEISRIGMLIRKSAASAVDLLANLMVWSQSQTGRIKFNPENLNVVQLVDETIYFMEDVAANKNIKIVKNIQEGLNVIADKDMLNAILRNIISNGIKFTHPGGLVTITVKATQEDILFSVADTGIGISEENLNKLFHIDENISTPGTNREEGTGLGLILCKTFVEKHKGRIWVESRTGSEEVSGTTFWFTIPAKGIQ